MLAHVVIVEYVTVVVEYVVALVGTLETTVVSLTTQGALTIHSLMLRWTIIWVLHSVYVYMYILYMLCMWSVYDVYDYAVYRVYIYTAQIIKFYIFMLLT